MKKIKRYEGIDNDPHGAMNATGNIIRDAWVFGLIPENETCEGWNFQGIDALYEKVSVEWDKYGHLASNLPDDLREKHANIYNEAVERARSLGWDPSLGEND